MMMLGFSISRNKGRRCISIRLFSRVNDGLMLLMWYVNLPRWVVISIYSEYSAVINIFSPMRIIVMFDQENDDNTIRISPIKLMVGGRARFDKLARSHQSAISGKMVCRPRARNIVRL